MTGVAFAFITVVMGFFAGTGEYVAGILVGLIGFAMIFRVR